MLSHMVVKLIARTIIDLVRLRVVLYHMVVKHLQGYSEHGGEIMRHKMRQWKADLLTAFGAGMSIGVLIGMLGFALIRSFFW